jgi:ferredoxin-type protein NapG
VARKRPGKFLTGQDGDRREFFRETLGQLVSEVAERAEKRVAPQRHFRPPGAIDEIQFLATCTRCSVCIDVCPVNAIVKAPSSSGLAVGSPILRPEIRACVVCEDMPCAQACAPRALIVPPRLWEGYRFGKLALDPDRCITFDGVTCGVCVDVCPVGETAIVGDEEGRPVIKEEGCVGCGECVKACVTRPSSLKLFHEDR